jgi:hypothetical protein
MIIVNLNEERILEYKVSGIEKIERVHLVVTFPNSVVYRFVGSIDKENEKVLVSLPVLKDIIKKEINTTCYLEVGNSEKYYKIPVDDLSFKFKVDEISVNILIPDEVKSLEATYVKNEEIILDPKTVVTKKRTRRIQ